MKHPQHLYIHIPFCHRRCSYCDFNTYANLEHRIEAYVAALCAELAMLEPLTQEQPAPAAPAPLSSAAVQPSVFFGGGTPSMLTLAQLERILRAADRLVPLAGAEVSLEANPGTVLGADTDAYTYLRGLRGLGINRLSLGVQSLHDPTLRILGRTHSAAEARQCFDTARRAGFESINLDFMFGLPGQTPAQWAAALDEVVTWGSDHFALYSLILEESTPLYAQVVGGRVSVPDDDATAEMYSDAMERLGAAGYVQYEISNWARATPRPAPLHPALPAHACQHNLAYWLNSDYLAAGAGAHGHCYPQRYYNLLAVDAYIAAVQAGQRPLAEVIDLTPRDLCAETLFMNLRLNAGISVQHFAERCGTTLEAAYGAEIYELQQQGLLEHHADTLRLTARGRMLGNQVFARFVT